MDGFEATAILKSGNDSNIPVVALTGYGREDKRRKCNEVGFDDYYTKPLKQSQLLELLDKYAPGHRCSG
jgi:CheY-like chemotaxis protein